MLEKVWTPARTVALWGLANAVLVAVLAGFVLVGFGNASQTVIEIYGASAFVVLVVSVLVLFAGRLRKTFRGYRVPVRPASALLFATGFALLWLGLPFGMWVLFAAIAPFTVATILELSAGRWRM